MQVRRLRPATRPLERARWGQFERLERRECPAAPTLNGLSAVTSTGTQVTLQGYVSDESPQTSTVAFSGVLSGSATPNAYGWFSAVLNGSILGVVNAIATDNQALSSATASVTLTSQVPTVSVGATQNAADRYVTVQGNVTDETLGGRTVTLSGVVSGTAVTDAQGHYSVTLQASGLGTINATVADPWGQVSNQATYSLSSATPSIMDFVAIHMGGNQWKFKGKVIDEYAPGLTVTFGGLLQGSTAIVQNDGTFELIRTVFGDGEATAQVTDWWGLASLVASDWVDNV